MLELDWSVNTPESVLKISGKFFLGLDWPEWRSLLAIWVPHQSFHETSLDHSYFWL